VGEARHQAGGERRVQARPDNRNRARQALDGRDREIGLRHDGAGMERQQLGGGRAERESWQARASKYDLVL